MHHQLHVKTVCAYLMGLLSGGRKAALDQWDHDTHNPVN